MSTSLINAVYYVVSDQPEKLFGDYLPEREIYRFSKLYPQSWQKVLPSNKRVILRQ